MTGGAIDKAGNPHRFFGYSVAGRGFCNCRSLLWGVGCGISMERSLWSGIRFASYLFCWGELLVRYGDREIADYCRISYREVQAEIGRAKSRIIVFPVKSAA